MGHSLTFIFRGIFIGLLCRREFFLRSYTLPGFWGDYLSLKAFLGIIYLIDIFNEILYFTGAFIARVFSIDYRGKFLVFTLRSFFYGNIYENCLVYGGIYRGLFSQVFLTSFTLLRFWRGLFIFKRNLWEPFILLGHLWRLSTIKKKIWRVSFYGEYL